MEVAVFMIKTYFELIQLETFEQRFNYAKFAGAMIGEETFGAARYLNQRFYQSRVWRSLRDEVIVRDNGFDLAHPDYPISGGIRVHHLNPITEEDILADATCLCDLNNLICTSLLTHNAVHYGDFSLVGQAPTVRRPNDTIPWRR
jgi:hypothetical protein